MGGGTANNPTTNDQYKFTGVAQTNGSGELILQGCASVGYAASGATTTGFFINGFEINEFTGLTLEVNATTGDVQLLNEQGSPLSLSYHEIRSSSGALNHDDWNSLDNQESGDPVGTGWDEAVESSANILSEANLQSQLDPAASVGASLGAAFNTAGIHDLQFFYAEAADTQLRPGLVKYVTTGVPGDYNGNGVVDAADYVLWRKGGPLQNEVHDPGTVSAEDYTEWRAPLWQYSGSGARSGAVRPFPNWQALYCLHWLWRDQQLEGATRT